MIKLDERTCQLESGAGSSRLLDAYDVGTDTWKVSFEGNFWNAVDHAHNLDRRGQGARIAIIDSAFDLSLPTLSLRVLSSSSVSPGQDNSHGTAVALLIARVAPEARFDLYSVARGGGRIDPGDVAAAIDTAAASEASILNISLGAATVVADLDRALGALSPGQVAAYLSQPDALLAKSILADVIASHADCSVCASALSARRAGKMVFAAAGNNGAQILCPARSAGAIAGAFQSESQSIVDLPGNAGQAQVAAAGDPHAPQSLFNDIALREADGVLGTSFASPLLAGAAALGMSAPELTSYINAVRPGMDGANYARRKTLGQGETKELTTWAEANFERAMRLLPHVHSSFEASLRRETVDVSPPDSCAICGLFSYATYINYGLFLLDLGAWTAAASILRAAVALSPWSAAAAADYGRTLQNLGDLEGALGQYDRAVGLGPEQPLYLRQREIIKGLIEVKDRLPRSRDNGRPRAGQAVFPLLTSPPSPPASG